MFTLILYQELSVIQFYQVFYKNYPEFVMSDWEIVNISRMINSRNMKFCKNYSNRDTLKVVTFGDRSMYGFWAIKHFFCRRQKWL